MRLALILFLLVQMSFISLCHAQRGPKCTEPYSGYISKSNTPTFVYANSATSRGYKVPSLSVDNLFRLVNLKMIDWKLSIREWTNFQDGPMPFCQGGACEFQYEVTKGTFQTGLVRSGVFQVWRQKEYSIGMQDVSVIEKFERSLAPYYCHQNDTGETSYAMVVNGVQLEVLFYSVQQGYYVVTVLVRN